MNIYLEGGGGKGNDLEVYGMTSPWEEGVHFDDIGVSNWTEATSTKSWNTPGGDFTSTMLGSIATPTNNNYLSTGLTVDTIQKWIDSPSENFGVAILSSGNTINWMEFRSREAAANKVPYLDLQLKKLPSIINSNSIVWNGITDLAVGTSDTIEISFLAIDTCTYHVNEVFGENALDALGGISTDSDNATISIGNFSIDTTIQDQSCFNISDGKIKIIVSGGTPDYSYSWSTGSVADSIEYLAAGTYTVTISDAGNYVDSLEFVVVTPPELLITIDSVSNYNGFSITCNGENDGAIYTTPSGGILPYIFAWNIGGGASEDTTGLVEGTYEVTVTDAIGCTAIADTILTEPTELIGGTDFVRYYGNGLNISCEDAIDGIAVAFSYDGAPTNPTGVAPYTYVWSNGQTEDTLRNVGAGTYYVTATDVNGCTRLDSITFVNPSPRTASITQNTSIECVGGNEASVTVIGTGGSGGDTYLWSIGATTQSIGGLVEGTYTVTITDENNCQVIDSILISDPDSIITTGILGHPGCTGNDGTISINNTGGTAPYTQSWSTGVGTTTISGLSAGTYPVYVRNKSQTCLAGPEYVTIAEPDAPIIFSAAGINPQTAVSSDGEILVEAEGASSPLEYRLIGVTPWQTSSYFQGLNPGNYIIEVRNQGEDCSVQRPTTLISGGSLYGNSSASYCSDDFSNEQISETYYIPIPEDQALNSLEQLYPSSCGSSSLPTSPIRSYVSISIVESDAMIYYDHLEDDFENDLGNILQSTTEIWGDGDLTNGIAPGYASDILTAGDVIILDQNVNVSTRSSVIDFDGGDKIASRGNLAIIRLAWASGSGTYLAGAVEIYPTVDWGRNFVLPVGEDYSVNEMFDYVGTTIMAFEDNTSINIDADADGLTETSVTLNEGQSYLINGGINVGAMITADKSIQVHLLTGDICANYEGRWITLTPRDEWSNSYYNPVSTQIDASDPSGSSNDPTYVHIHNPNNNLINVAWETVAVSQPNINVLAGTTVWVEVPEGTGSYFYTNNGAAFYAIATIGSDGETLMHDWGFGLIPETQLTPQITMVGFAPGQDPTYTGGSTSNTAPVWLTGNYPTGSSYSGSITICVDYNGDGGGFLDVNGVPYDVTYSLNPLSQLKITDPDGDQTGMRIWVCDNSDAFVAGAWGQDPAISTGSGLEEIDLGTGLPNGIPFNTNECVDLTYELNNDGLFDVCEEVSYTISMQNSGALPFPANTILITDTLAAELDYLDNSTVYYVNGLPTTWTDDSAPPASSTFPFDEGGAYYLNVILPGDSVEIVFTASINAQPSGDGIIRNPIIVFDG